ncbi:hypothetical protein HMPREF0731_0348, partial [Pseudoroseomonas cervicalis ATCC 49957]
MGRRWGGGAQRHPAGASGQAAETVAGGEIAALQPGPQPFGAQPGLALGGGVGGR